MRLSDTLFGFSLICLVLGAVVTEIGWIVSSTEVAAIGYTSYGGPILGFGIFLLMIGAIAFAAFLLYPESSVSSESQQHFEPTINWDYKSKDFPRSSPKTSETIKRLIQAKED